MPSIRFSRRLVPAAAALALAGAFAAGAVHAGAPDDSAAARQREDTGYALVQLAGDPLATGARTRPARGKKIDFSSSAVRAQRAQLAALRNDYKAWLRANVPGARITGEYDISLNAVSVQLNGATLDQVRATPMVRHAQYQGLYYPVSASDPDLGLIDAETAWAVGGGPATAGDGVKVAVIDTGIDHQHPCFSGAGYPSQPQLGDRRFTNNKVIAARVFNNKVPSRGYSAAAVQDHGTHVAGTVACNHGTPASVSGVAIPFAISGVAPRALLGNYNVFPADVENARSEDILNALEAAYADGFDVANMSLGGGSSGIQDLLTVAVDNLDQANMVVAVSNGNEGPGPFTVGSPGMAARALTAGASSVPHFVGAPVAAAGQVFGGATGDFATVAADLTAPLAVVPGATQGLDTACTALPAGSLTGTIALISRGACTFSTKIRNAQSAGAVAVLVANNVAGDPAAMGSDGSANQPTVPAYMVSTDSGQALRTLGGASTTIGAAQSYLQTANADIMAGFSSVGPTDVEFRVKPDVVAPGVNVLSSIPLSFCGGAPCFAFLSGTSMAAPHLAGSAAVLRQQQPDWSAAEIRSAIVNTARTDVLRRSDNGQPETRVTVVGAGRQDLNASAQAQVALSPVSLSFGPVPSGSGQTMSRAITLTNLRGSAQALNLSVSGANGGVAYSVTPASVNLGPHESTEVTVTMTAAKGATAGARQATLQVGTAAHAVLFTWVK